MSHHQPSLASGQRQIKNFSRTIDSEYKRLLNTIMELGREKDDRTGTGTIATFGQMLKVNADPEQFPILLGKKMFFRGIVEELLWFISGSTNIKPLIEKGVHIWNGDAYKKYRSTPISQIDINFLAIRTKPYPGHEKDEKIIPLETGELTHDYLTENEFIERIRVSPKFAEKWGELGPVYGKQWREWPTYKTDGFETWKGDSIDQFKAAIETLKTNPDSRRIIVNAWNPADVPSMTLPPCHFAYQFQTEVLTEFERRATFEEKTNSRFDGQSGRLEMFSDWPTRRLNLAMSQRSADCFLGVPFNITSYALLLNLVAREVNMIPGELTIFFGDLHLYKNHMTFVEEFYSRDTSSMKYPKLSISAGKSIFDLKSEDISLIDYQALPNWKDVPLSN